MVIFIYFGKSIYVSNMMILMWMKPIWGHLSQRVYLRVTVGVGVPSLTVQLLKKELTVRYQSDCTLSENQHMVPHVWSGQMTAAP